MHYFMRICSIFGLILLNIALSIQLFVVGFTCFDTCPANIPNTIIDNAFSLNTSESSMIYGAIFFTVLAWLTELFLLAFQHRWRLLAGVLVTFLVSWGGAFLLLRASLPTTEDGLSAWSNALPFGGLLLNGGAVVALIADFRQ